MISNDLMFLRKWISKAKLLNFFTLTLTLRSCGFFTFLKTKPQKMIEIIEPTEGNVVSTRATGKLTKEDYNKILPVLEGKEDRYEKISWYFEMENFEGWDLQAAWKDLKFDIKYANKLEKVAMVGAKDWEQKLTKVMKPFTSAEVRFFDLSEKEEARNWIRA